MQQKNIFVLVAVFCCLSLISCQKDISDPNTNPSGTDSTGQTSSLVKAISWIQNNDSAGAYSGKYVYEYDTKQRLTNTFYYLEYNYNTFSEKDTSAIHLHYTDSASLQPYGYTSFGKEYGQILKSEHIIKYNANNYPILDSIIDGDGGSYTHTNITPSSNHVVYKVHYKYSDYATYDSLFLDNNQQIVKIKSGLIYEDTIYDRSSISITEYTYTTIPNPGFNVNLAAIFWNSSLNIVNFKYLPASETSWPNGSATPDSKVTYQYTKDSSGRVKTLTAYQNGKSKVVATWEYY